MTATEDLFTPIHKAIRSMIYNVGSRMQTNDFADLTASKPLLADLEHEFTAAVSAGCVLCILHHHASDEEKEVFPSIATYTPDLIQSFIDDHHDLTRRLGVITKMAHELVTLPHAPERVRQGLTLTQETNAFFAAYLTHMNREEETLVPFMREHFSDDQMRAMRGAIMRGMPPDRLASILGWMFPSLNIDELTEMVGGIKRTSPPEVFQFISGIATKHLTPERWRQVTERVGL